MSLAETQTRSTDRTPRGFWAEHASLIAAVAVAISLRVAIVLIFPQMPMFGDEFDYFRGARELAAGSQVSVLPFRPPLYLWFVTGLIEIAGPSTDAIRIAQAGLEGLCVALMFPLGLAVAGRRGGLVAAWIFALYPDFIGYSHTLWSESFSLVVMLAALLFTLRLFERPSTGVAIAAGVGWGALCLIKPYHVYLTPLLLGCSVVFAAREERAKMLRCVATSLAAVLLVIAPWSAYLSLTHERPILISTTGALNLRDGTNYYPPPQYDFPYPQRVPAELVATLGRSESLPQFVWSNPGLFLTRAGEKMGYLWSPNSYVIRHLYSGKYGPPGAFSRSTRMGVAALVMLSTAGILLLAIPGYCASGAAFMAALSAVYVVPYVAMITITPSLSRYRLPIMIFAVLYAACFLAGGKASLLALRRPRVWVPSLLGCGALALAWYARVPEVLAALR